MPEKNVIRIGSLFMRLLSQEIHIANHGVPIIVKTSVPSERVLQKRLTNHEVRFGLEYSFKRKKKGDSSSPTTEPSD